MKQSRSTSQPRLAPPRWLCLQLLVVMFTGLVLAGLMRPELCGFSFDDGVYFMAAQSLAAGKGYLFAHEPQIQGLVKYPPLFPLWLSIWLKGFPDFPQNLLALKGLNILLAMGYLTVTGWLMHTVLRFRLDITLIVLLLLGLNQAMVPVTIELMSEPLFLVMMMSGLAVLLHRRPNPDHWPAMLSMAGGCVLLFYTRSIGVIAAAAVLLSLWRSGHGKAALRTGLLILAGCLPWLIWVAVQPDRTQWWHDGSGALIRNYNESYLRSLLMDLKLEYTIPDLLSNGMAALYQGLLTLLFPIGLSRNPVLFVVGNTALIAIFLTTLLQGIRSVRARWIWPDCLPPVFLALTVIILPLWSYLDDYPRFLLMVLPMLWWALLKPFQASRWGTVPQGFSGQLMQGGVIILLLLSLGSQGVQVQRRWQTTRGNHLLIAPQTTPPWPLVSQKRDPTWQEMTEGFALIRRKIPPGEPLYTNLMAIPLSLYTDRPVPVQFILMPRLKSLSSEEANRIWPEISRTLARIQYEDMQRHGFRYIISMPWISHGQIQKTVHPFTQVLLETYPESIQPVGETTHGLIRIYRFSPRE
ncbi:MAG: hypothetical protein AB7P76_03950 [Candidatus Melainabacteria bacterium]